MVMSSKILGIRDRTKNFDPSDLEIGHIFPIILSHIPNTSPYISATTSHFLDCSRPLLLCPMLCAAHSCPSLFHPMLCAHCPHPLLVPVAAVTVALCTLLVFAAVAPIALCPLLVFIAVAPVTLCSLLVSVVGARCCCHRQGSRHHCCCYHRPLLPSPIAIAGTVALAVTFAVNFAVTEATVISPVRETTINQ